MKLPVAVVVVVVRVEPIGVSIGVDCLYRNGGGGVGRTVSGPRVGPPHATAAAPEGGAEARGGGVDVPAGGRGSCVVAGGPAGTPG